MNVPEPKASFGPTDSGATFTSTKHWRLYLLGQYEYCLVVGDEKFSGMVDSIEKLTIDPGMFWSSVCIQIADHGEFNLDGIPNLNARFMITIVQREIDDYQVHLVDDFLPQLDTDVHAMVAWHKSVQAGSKAEFKKSGWLGEDYFVRMQKEKPESGLARLINAQVVQAKLKTFDKRSRAAVDFWNGLMPTWVKDANEKHVQSELIASKDLFDSVEKSPLSEEQARSVICFDKRVLVVAAAGSGKTSTMVAKAGYAIKKKLVKPEQILMLAFNTDAAKELGERVKTRLKPFDMGADAINVSTFHAFGLSVIGEATGKKPRLASWVANEGVLRELLRIVEHLRESEPGFALNWEMYRFVLNRDLPTFGEKEMPEDWDSVTKARGFRTLQGEVVKSRGELIIANWLFFNSVEYVYERTYEFSTADQEHSQYQPDFYLPAIKTYYEHWGLNAAGQPPPSFHGYLDSIDWKMKLHAQHGTQLIETTTAQLYSGEAFEILEREFRARGLELKPDSDRIPQGKQPILNAELLRVIQAFMTHVKSNRLTPEDLQARTEFGEVGDFKWRHKIFLKLFGAIRDEWQARLAKEGAVDFEDMLNLAADHIEAGDWVNPYELICVDEFQDSSRARARLVRALIKNGATKLFAVGDDWQSINRFAGADIALMSSFHASFGNHELCTLQQTYRCPQSICDVSSAFVQKNPAQIRKTVTSTSKTVGTGVLIRTAASENAIGGLVRGYLDEISVAHAAAGGAGRLSVLVLGRYRRDQECMPDLRGLSKLDVKFQTVHGSKGLEADYVVLPRVMSGAYSFPSGIQDDPILKLAMPEPEDYAMAEERRLLYVAITRAKVGVLLLTVAGRESQFIVELSQMAEASNGAIKYEGAVDGVGGAAPAAAKVCSGCGSGFMKSRNGRNGSFWGCSRFPACGHTEPGEGDRPRYSGRRYKRQ